MQHAFLKELAGNGTRRMRFNDGDGKSKVNESESRHMYYQTAPAPRTEAPVRGHTSVRGTWLSTPSNRRHGLWPRREKTRLRPWMESSPPRAGCGGSRLRLRVPAAPQGTEVGLPLDKEPEVAFASARLGPEGTVPLALHSAPCSPSFPKPGRGYDDGKLVSALPWCLPLGDSLNAPCFPNSCSG